MRIRSANTSAAVSAGFVCSHHLIGLALPFSAIIAASCGTYEPELAPNQQLAHTIVPDVQYQVMVRPRAGNNNIEPTSASTIAHRTMANRHRAKSQSDEEQSRQSGLFLVVCSSSGVMPNQKGEGGSDGAEGPGELSGTAQPAPLAQPGGCAASESLPTPPVVSASGSGLPGI